MLELIGESGAVLLIGAVGGLMLGLAARLGRFCTLGMIEDRALRAGTVGGCGCGSPRSALR